MKCIYKYILFFVFLVPVLTRAQDKPAIFANYKEGGGVATAKRVTGPDANDDYTLTLETFATGEKSILKKAIPSDIILLLDYSSSMLMSGSASSTSTDIRDRLYNLKNAIGSFVTLMKQNNETLKPSLADNQVGNRIAFVIYAGKVYDKNQPTNVTNGVFYAEHMKEFLSVDDLTVQPLTEHHPINNQSFSSTSVVYTDSNNSSIDILRPSSQYSGSNPGYGGINLDDIGDVNKGTNSGAAMEVALALVNQNLAYIQQTGEKRSTTVIMFTDGEPATGSSGARNPFDNDIASACVNSANQIKGLPASAAAEDRIKVFTVGLFSASGETRQIKTYLEYTSSDFSNKSWITPPNPTEDSSKNWDGYECLPGQTTYGNYCKVVSDGLNLTDVFATIAEASGGSAATIPTQTEVRDIVNTSYTIPEGFSPSSVTVYWQSPTTDGTDWNTTKHTLTTVEAKKTDVLTGNNPVSYITDDSKVGILVDGSKLTILGFDYSKADTGDATAADFNPDGNWVGWRQVNRDVNNDGSVNDDDKICAGKKLVISFKIKAAPGATGGDGTNTNTSDSGVYVPSFDSNGNITGYTNVNSYPVPHADIPINIVIEKYGLKHGESATIQIYWAPQSTEYNKETGKLKPDLDTEWDGANATNHKGWGNFSKLILTNQGEDNTVVTETLLCLDPKYVYLLAEDDWGWSYDLDTESIDTSEQEFNPFVFINTPKTNVVKHAEAASFNYFKGPDYTPAKKTITVKSKAKLSTPANGGN